VAWAAPTGARGHPNRHFPPVEKTILEEISPGNPGAFPMLGAQAKYKKWKAHQKKRTDALPPKATLS